MAYNHYEDPSMISRANRLQDSRAVPKGVGFTGLLRRRNVVYGVTALALTTACGVRINPDAQPSAPATAASASPTAAPSEQAATPASPATPVQVAQAPAILKPGMRDVNGSTAIHGLEVSLQSIGCTGIVMDGYFGNSDRAAVETFQQSQHLTADGFAGTDTTSALSRATAANVHTTYCGWNTPHAQVHITTSTSNHATTPQQAPVPQIPTVVVPSNGPDPNLCKDLTGLWNVPGGSQNC